MNTLVSLGALASFGMSAAAVALPRLGWPTFFEEPVMLLAFVLLGRAVEERAKLRATSDMSALLNLLPATARLVSGGAGGGSDAGSADASSYFREVPTNALIADDLILVLPGDRIPVDGVVAKGTSQVDEAAINGEPIPRPRRRDVVSPARSTATAPSPCASSPAARRRRWRASCAWSRRRSRGRRPCSGWRTR